MELFIYHLFIYFKKKSYKTHTTTWPANLEFLGTFSHHTNRNHPLFVVKTDVKLQSLTAEEEKTYFHFMNNTKKV